MILSFVREQTCIQAVIVYTVDGHTRTIENGETKDALLSTEIDNVSKIIKH